MKELKFEKNKKSKEHDHNAFECNMHISNLTKLYAAVGAVSKIFNEYNIDYFDFWEAISILDHYYKNFFEMMEVDIKPETGDIEEAFGIVLPSILDDEWC